MECVENIIFMNQIYIVICCVFSTKNSTQNHDHMSIIALGVFDLAPIGAIPNLHSAHPKSLSRQ